MSRNFELLQRLSKEQEILDTGAEFSTIPPVEVSSSPLHVVSPPLREESRGELVESEPVKLEMEDQQRDELLKLVQRVFVMPGSAAPRTVLLTGTEPGIGCSWICCRAAEILASQVKGPICIVDANLRSPALHRCFGVLNHHGLSDALEATEPIRNFVSPLSVNNLWLLSCGSNPSNATSISFSDPLRLRLVELRQYFEYVLIDAPALSLGIDGIMLGGAADGVVLILKANASRREAARKAVQELQDAGAKVLGAVLNQRTFPIPQAIYSKL